jgi:transcriptional regulator with XRE-family HTH domain
MCQGVLAKHPSECNTTAMQKPAKRHVLADIRIQCGLTQDQLAEILDRKKVSIQKIEQGQMTMSEELADKAEEQLDVSAAWLLENDPDSSPVTSRGGRWTKELFEFAQGARSMVTEKKLDGKSSFRIRSTGTRVDPVTRRIRSGPFPLEGAKSEFVAWKVQDTTAKVHALLVGTEGSPSQGILLHRLNTALKKLMEQFKPDESVLAAYEPDLEKLRSAYDKVADRIEEEEHARIWREEEGTERSKQKVR